MSFVDILINTFSAFNLNYTLMLLLAVIIPGLIIFLLMTVNAIVAVYMERKISAFMQDRLGPMEVGLFGFKGGKKFWGGIGQTIADAIKLLSKEDIIPKDADKFMMILAPFIIFIASFITFVGVPLSENFLISNFNVGVLYILAMGSVGVIGIILAGWASNNKWSLYGAMRAASQIISYEIPIGLTLLLPVIVSGGLDVHTIVNWQLENRWLIIHSPFTFIAFFIFFVSGIAETNRVPFDIPESESELAFEINTRSPEKLAKTLLTYGGKMLYISTDFVFDGKDGPYHEDDPISPISVYGKTKSDAEKLLLDKNPNHLVIRGNVLYSENYNSKSNFLGWVVNSLKNGMKIKVVNDQFNNPTWTKSMADIIELCISNDTTGILHWADADYLSRYEFSKKIASKLGLEISLIKEVKTKDLQQIAKRPLKCGLLADKAIKTLDVIPPTLEECLKKINVNQ